MGYVRGDSPQPASTVLTVEQARRRNAALRLELVAITAENVQLETKVETMRRDVSAARRKLSRQIRDLDTVRAQADQLAAAALHVSTSPEPVHGGREGLQAATEEMAAHEDQQLKLSKAPRRRTITPPSHGTRRKYEEGCDCAKCLAWRDRKTELESRRRRSPREEKAAA